MAFDLSNIINSVLSFISPKTGGDNQTNVDAEPASFVTATNQVAPPFVAATNQVAPPFVAATNQAAPPQSPNPNDVNLANNLRTLAAKSQNTAPNINVLDLLGEPEYTDKQRIAAMKGIYPDVNAADLFPNMGQNIYQGSVSAGGITTPIFTGGGQLFPVNVLMNRQNALNKAAMTAEMMQERKPLEIPKIDNAAILTRFQNDFVGDAQNFVRDYQNKYPGRNIKDITKSKEFAEFKSKWAGLQSAINFGTKEAINYLQEERKDPAGKFRSPEAIAAAQALVNGVSLYENNQLVDDPAEIVKLTEKFKSYEKYDNIINKGLEKVHLTRMKPEDFQAKLNELQSKIGKGNYAENIDTAIEKLTDEQTNTIINDIWNSSKEDLKAQMPNMNDEQIKESVKNSIKSKVGEKVYSELKILQQKAGTTFNFGQNISDTGGVFYNIANQNDNNKLIPKLDKSLENVKSEDESKIVAKKILGNATAEVDPDIFGVYVGNWKMINKKYDSMPYKDLLDVNYKPVNPKNIDESNDVNAQTGDLKIDNVMIGYAQKEKNGQWKILKHKNVSALKKIPTDYKLVTIIKLSESRPASVGIGTTAIDKFFNNKKVADILYDIQPLNSITATQLDDIAFPSRKNVTPGSGTISVPSNENTEDNSELEIR